MPCHFYQSYTCLWHVKIKTDLKDLLVRLPERIIVKIETTFKKPGKQSDHNGMQVLSDVNDDLRIIGNCLRDAICRKGDVHKSICA